ncbi:uncharacterized protein LOC123544768 [Mercenaria mercenaria]|uniref:uncharacterized protein LOC123544768 n=1 Tax=Mercenaria mercenaria TaxID=6596 RepID=UPI001E1D953A|nr:uncharacterized protein LOC123544768 [Mercenaria mercenaria]
MFFVIFIITAWCSQMSVAQTCDSHLDSYIGCQLEHMIKEDPGDVGFEAAGIVINGTDLIFPNVVYNFGGSYNNTTGQVKVPTSGLYAMSVALELNPMIDNENDGSFVCHFLFSSGFKVKISTNIAQTSFYDSPYPYEDYWDPVDKRTKPIVALTRPTVFDTLFVPMIHGEVVKIGGCTNTERINTKAEIRFKGCMMNYKIIR